jgi:hypothetical protein
MRLYEYFLVLAVFVRYLPKIVGSSLHFDAVEQNTVLSCNVTARFHDDWADCVFRRNSGQRSCETTLNGIIGAIAKIVSIQIAAVTSHKTANLYMKYNRI